MRTQRVLTDDDLYQSQRAALGLSPDRQEQILPEPAKPAVSYEQQKIIDQVRQEWEAQQELERLMVIEHKCNQNQYYQW